MLPDLFNLSSCWYFYAVALPHFGAKYFDFKRATVFCLGHRLSEHKTTRYARNWGEAWSLQPLPPWLRLCFNAIVFVTILQNANEFGKDDDFFEAWHYFWFGPFEFCWKGTDFHRELIKIAFFSFVRKKTMTTLMTSRIFSVCSEGVMKNSFYQRTHYQLLTRGRRLFCCRRFRIRVFPGSRSMVFY